jgi:hypothetical protein
VFVRTTSVFCCVRVDRGSRAFTAGTRRKFVQYGSNLNEPATFGQPGARFTQVFGSGGPRAVQLGARLSF